MGSEEETALLLFMEFPVSAPEQPLCRAALGKLPVQNGCRWGEGIWSPTTTGMVQKKNRRGEAAPRLERRAAFGGEQGQMVVWAVFHVEAQVRLVLWVWESGGV